MTKPDIHITTDEVVIGGNMYCVEISKVGKNAYGLYLIENSVKVLSDVEPYASIAKDFKQVYSSMPVGMEMGTTFLAELHRRWEFNVNAGHI